MTTRFTAKGRQNYGVEPLSSGYQGVSDPNLSLPPVDVEDVDFALFNLFEKEIDLQCGGKDSAPTTKVPVIFAAGEKWALLKKQQPLRDRKQSLILPLVTIVRTNMVQALAEDVTGRGINQQTGELVIQRRLGSSDRSYQGLLNRLHLKNQANLAVGTSEAQGGLRTRRGVGDLEDDVTIVQGGRLLSDTKNNVIETLVIPSPQFYTANYEVTVWTQYVQHMNQIINRIMSSLLMQAQCWRIETQSGYWFVANLEGDSMTMDTNMEDMSQEERYFKQKLNINVPAYVLATSEPGGRVPVKRYVSSPEIEFTVDTSYDPNLVDEPDLGSDDPTLPLATNKTVRRDGRETGRGRVFASNGAGVIDPNDPALKAYPRGLQPGQYKKFIVNGQVKYVRVKKTNAATGEQTFGGGVDLGSFSFIVVDE